VSRNIFHRKSRVAMRLETEGERSAAFFEKSAHCLVKSPAKNAFIYADVDIYQSTRSCLDFFYPRMVHGGVMIFDDYEWKGCPGVKKAISEFLAGKNEIPIITTRYQCILLKA